MKRSFTPDQIKVICDALYLASQWELSVAYAWSNVDDEEGLKTHNEALANSQKFLDLKRKINTTIYSPKR